MKTFVLDGVPFTAQTVREAVDAMLEAASTGRRLRVHFCNVHTFTESQSNAPLRAVFASADMVAMDGMPIVWVARRHGFENAKRVTGPDTMLDVCDRGRDLGLRHYFLGGQVGVPELLRDRLVARYPGLRVVGVESPPFRPLSREEDEEMVDRINGTDADVLWVGLGAPKQEFWVADHAGRLTTPLLIPVGAAFDFHSGRVRRAPGWMRRLGLEWLFRLLMQPRRLFYRYATTNSKFVVSMLRSETRRGRGEG